MAQFVSVLFHPLYVVVYVYALFTIVNPFQFSNFNRTEQGVFFISLMVLSVIIPIVSILMMKFLGMIGGLEMEERTDRIGPLIVTGICYLWLTINFYKNGEIPQFLTSFMLGATISLFLGFLINLAEKISLHTVGFGGLIAAYCIMIYKYGYGFATINFAGVEYYVHLMLILAILIFLGGLIGSARLYLGRHVSREVYGGFLVGMIGQVIALRIIF